MHFLLLILLPGLFGAKLGLAMRDQKILNLVVQESLLEAIIPISVVIDVPQSLLLQADVIEKREPW